MTESKPRLPSKVLCPRCGEVAAWSGNPFRPFCSERCKMIDLGAWADEAYKVPGKPLDPEDAIALLEERESNKAKEQEEP